MPIIRKSCFTKPTDKKAYLHAKSYHPKSTKDAIAFSQVLRIRRICNEDSEFNKNSKKLINDLVDRGYSSGAVKNGVEKNEKHWKTAASVLQREEIIRSDTFDCEV